MIQFSIRLPSDMYKAIKTLAGKERRSLNSQLVKLLEESVCEPICQEKQEEGIVEEDK